jgi:hypothetical protein
MEEELQTAKIAKLGVRGFHQQNQKRERNNHQKEWIE